MEKQSVKISKTILKKLKGLGKMGDSYEDVIERLIKIADEKKQSGSTGEDSNHSRVETTSFEF